MNLKRVMKMKILIDKNIFPRQNVIHTTLRKFHKYHSRLVSVWFRTIFKCFTVTLALFPSSVLKRDLGTVCFALLINPKYMQQCSQHTERLNAKNLIHKITHPKRNKKKKRTYSFGNAVFARMMEIRAIQKDPTAY